VDTRADGTWTGQVDRLPAGGLYRLETILQLDDGPIEWGRRGDMVHHLGVGDVWVITGQSNSSGYGKTPITDGPELGLHLFHASGKWTLATHPLSDSTGSRYTPNREGANGSHSPYLQFARVLKRELGYPIGLIPAALGGSPMKAWLRSVDGILFKNMLRYVEDAGTQVRGVLWYQGESDTADTERGLYLERFRELVADFRQAFHRPDLPVITCQLNRYVGEAFSRPVHRYWELMREIQRQAAHTIPGVSVISTLDLTLSDGIHNDSRSNLVIGDRMAAAALGTTYHRPVKHRHPDLVEARLAAPTVVELTFANVDMRLHFEVNIPEQFPFELRDSQGVVPVAKWQIVGGRNFRLELARAPVGETTVVGAPTACPPVNVPFDLCGYRPMLAFSVPLQRG
jgi:hypothetical protein